MDTAAFAGRRERIARTMRDHGGGIAIVGTAPERQRNGDIDHPYRHGSDFHYLTGFAEPGAWQLIESGGLCTVLCRPKDAERGRRGVGPEPEAVPDLPLGIPGAAEQRGAAVGRHEQPGFGLAEAGEVVAVAAVAIGVIAVAVARPLRRGGH